MKIVPNNICFTINLFLKVKTKYINIHVISHQTLLFNSYTLYIIHLLILMKISFFFSIVAKCLKPQNQRIQLNLFHNRQKKYVDNITMCNEWLKIGKWTNEFFGWPRQTRNNQNKIETETPFIQNGFQADIKKKLFPTVSLLFQIEISIVLVLAWFSWSLILYI